MQAGVGFMALDENQAKIATILFEYEETKRQHALKLAEIQRVAKVFSDTGNALSMFPLYVSFSGESLPPQFSNRSMAKVVEPNEFDMPRLRELLKELRELELKKDRLTKERKAIGYPTD